jgi:hypothetical protein
MKFRSFARAFCSLSFFAVACFSPEVSLAQRPTPPVKNVPAEPPAMEGRDSGSGPAEGTLKLSRVYFISPKDGETVKSPVTVKFGVEGMQIAPAGEATPGSGHFHLIVDGQPVPKGELVSTKDKKLHLSEGQTETKLQLKRGKHSLTLQFVDGEHRAYGEMMTQTITIRVK